MPGPAGSEHDRHDPRRGRLRDEVHERLVDRLVRVVGQQRVVEVGEVVAPAAAGESLFAAAAVLDDHVDRQPHQRTHVGREHAVAARDQHDVVFRAEVGHHLLHPAVARTREPLDLLEHPDLRGRVERRHRIVRAIERRLRAQRHLRRDLDLAGAVARDRARRHRRLVQRVERDVVRVGERGPVADDRAHAHALFDVEAAALDDAFLERIRLRARVLEVQVGVVGTVLEDRRQRALQLRFVQPVRVEQHLLGDGQAVEGGIGRLHRCPVGKGGKGGAIVRTRVQQRVRCSRAGSDARHAAISCGSMSPNTTPGPSGRLASTVPHGSISIEWP